MELGNSIRVCVHLWKFFIFFYVKRRSFLRVELYFVCVCENWKLHHTVYLFVLRSESVMESLHWICIALFFGLCFGADQFANYELELSYITASPLGVPQQVFFFSSLSEYDFYCYNFFLLLLVAFSLIFWKVVKSGFYFVRLYDFHCFFCWVLAFYQLLCSIHFFWVYF